MPPATETSRERHLRSKYGPLIGVDIDGVLYRWGEAARDTYATLRGLEIPDPPGGDDPYWNWITDQVSKDDWHWLWNNHDARRRMFACGRAYPDGVAGTKELCKMGRVVLMTHRPADVMDVTMRWLSNQKIVPHGLIHIGQGDKKWEHELRCETFVDDRAGNCEEIVRSQGITVHMPRRTYNARLWSPEHPDYTDFGGVRPFTDWSEIVSWVDNHLLGNQSNGSGI